MAYSYTLKLDMVWLSEIVNCYQPTLCRILEDGNLH